MFSRAILSSVLLAAKAAATIFYAGVAESGGEFAVYSNTATPGTGLPGRFGVDYQFINPAAIDIYVDQNKVNLFRVAFLLERMCPLSYGLGAKFNETASHHVRNPDRSTVAYASTALPRIRRCSQLHHRHKRRILHP